MKKMKCIDGLDYELSLISEFPQIKDDIHEVYLYHGQPIVYSIVDRIGNKYLVILIDWMSKDEDYVWLYLPITDRQIEEYVKVIDLVNLETVEMYQRKIIENATSEVYMSIMGVSEARHYLLSTK